MRDTDRVAAGGLKWMGIVAAAAIFFAISGCSKQASTSTVPPAAEPVMTEYQKVTDHIAAIASVHVGSAVVGSDGRYEVSGTITNKSSWPIRVLVEVSVGQVTYKLPEWWEIGPGGQRSFIAHPDAENGLGTVGGYVSDLEVKK